jgi:translation elongation factor EF-1alpha
VSCSKPQMLTLSSVLCSKKNRVPVCRHFEANIMTFGSDIPITKGTNFVLHVQNTSVPAYVEKFIAILGKGASIETKNPRILLGRISAAVVIRSKIPICLEEYTSIRSLGRFILRSADISVAAGVVTKIIA